MEGAVNVSPKRQVERIYELDYDGQGDAGITFSFICKCGTPLKVSESPWWRSDGECYYCGRKWTLHFYVEAEPPDES